MLRQLLDILEENSGQLTQEQICSRLNVSPEGLQSMLDILASKGKVTLQPTKESSGCAASCRDCSILLGCSLIKGQQETVYQLKICT